MNKSPTPASPPGLPPMLMSRLPRGPVAGWVPVSLAIHALWVAPWAALFAAIFKLIGIEGPIHLKDVDAGPTEIPIDLDEVDDEPQPMSGPTGDGDEAAKGGRGDAGADAAPDAPGDSSDEGGAEAGADAGPKRVADPSLRAGGLSGLKPSNKEINVRILLRLDHLRAHPIGAELGSRLTKIAQWKPFFEKTGIDPVRDLDAMLADGPRFYEISHVNAVLVHSKPDEVFTAAMHTIASSIAGSEWFGTSEVAAFRATIEDAKIALVQIPGGVIMTNESGVDQAMKLAHSLALKGKRASAFIPRGDADLVLSAYLRKPSNVLTAIPEDLNDTHIEIRTRKDGGAVIDIDARAKDAAHAEEAVEAGRKLVDSYAPHNLMGSLARQYIDGYTLVADGDVVHLHHELSGDQVNTIWTLLKLKGF